MAALNGLKSETILNMNAVEHDAIAIRCYHLAGLTTLNTDPCWLSPYWKNECSEQVARSLGCNELATLNALHIQYILKPY